MPASTRTVGSEPKGRSNRGSIGQLGAVPLEDIGDDLPLSPRRVGDVAHDASMSPSPHDGDLAEVLVERDQHPLLRKGNREDLRVARILVPIAGPDHLMTQGAELVAGAAPDARVDQDLQEPAGVRKGSTLSWPTRRRAYTRQAWMSSRSSQG